MLIKTEKARQSDEQQFEIGRFSGGFGLYGADRARTRRLAALGGLDAAARAADSRSSASLARRSMRKRLVLAASVCRSSAFGELDFTLLLFDGMFFGALPLASVQHPDYSESSLSSSSLPQLLPRALNPGFAYDLCAFHPDNSGPPLLVRAHVRSPTMPASGRINSPCRVRGSGIFGAGCSA